MERIIQEPSVPLGTPSHSPFIPDVSTTSPDFRFQLFKGGSRSSFPPNEQYAHSPLQHRQVTFTAADARGPDHEVRMATPKSGSRHSFPPLLNPYTLPTTLNSSSSQQHSNSPHRDGGSSRSPPGIMKAESAVSSHLRILSRPTNDYAHASLQQPRIVSAPLGQSSSSSPAEVSRGAGNAARTRMMMK